MQLLEIQYPDKPARFFIDGTRVSRATFESRVIAKQVRGKVKNCFSTRAVPMPGGTFKRFNYSCI